MEGSRISGAFLGAIGLIAIACSVGCSTEPTSRSDRELLQDDVASATKRMYIEDSGLHAFLSRAYGYAIFPSVGKGGLIAGGAFGRGQVYEQNQFIGYGDIAQATIGLQAGGQSFSEAIVFENAEALNRFKSGQFAFAANASAVALKAGAATSSDYQNGVAVFLDPVGGLMLEAAIGGQSFSFQPK